MENIRVTLNEHEADRLERAVRIRNMGETADEFGGAAVRNLIHETITTEEEPDGEYITLMVSPHVAAELRRAVEIRGCNEDPGRLRSGCRAGVDRYDGPKGRRNDQPTDGARGRNGRTRDSAELTEGRNRRARREDGRAQADNRRGPMNRLRSTDAAGKGMTMRTICDECEGTGVNPADPDEGPCPECDGTGEVEIDD